MALRQVLDVVDLVDRPTIDRERLVELFTTRGLTDVHAESVTGDNGSTTVVRAIIPGTTGHRAGGDAPTLGIIGLLGGVGARPEVVGLVSDGDGAITALAAALKLADMYQSGDRLQGDVMVTTHLSPDAPIVPHEPVPFMSSPLGVGEMCRLLVDGRMDAILSVDTTKGNWVINRRGFAISPTVKEGYVLKTSSGLLAIQQHVTGLVPAVFPVSTQDITPYGNGLDHLNSILQPATVTTAPVVGVAITAEVPVPGCASGASHEVDIELATRFCIEVAKAYTTGGVSFHDPEEFDTLVALYGPMTRLQTLGDER